MKIAIIGAGWYGCHLALILKKKGYEVTLLEKNEDIFSQVSGNFGIRLHKGPHYPRSLKTREYCRKDFAQFSKVYPELIVHHGRSIYGLGKTDSDGNNSKVGVLEFEKICKEDSSSHAIDIRKQGYNGLLSAFDIEEPSVVVGAQLRETFRNYLLKAQIEIRCNFLVESVVYQEGQYSLSSAERKLEFDKVINATGYQGLLPANFTSTFPFDMEVVYQPCLALVYKDLAPEEKPFSFIVMDGWFPCMMPYVEDLRETTCFDKYIMTHGCYTIMASCSEPKSAQGILDALSDDFVDKNIKSASEREMARFWPQFTSRFVYQGWKGQVLAKVKSKNEFRSAVTFSDPDGIIHVIPGKVSNIFDVEEEVLKFITEKECKNLNGYSFASNGVLDKAKEEIVEKPALHEPNTCTLNTYDKLKVYRGSKQSVLPLSFLRPDTSSDETDSRMMLNSEHGKRAS